MRRKVYAAVIAATLAVGMMGTSVMAETTASASATKKCTKPTSFLKIRIY